ncbi:MAG: caspase family protein [Deltaproteobacteria bacterium]|nr:caspase family protein [Deltaproteobacteria bacterium]
MTRWLLGSMLLALVVAGASPARGAQRRVALLVAHPKGGDDLVPLRYTANDLERMREVLTSLGDFAKEDVLVSYAESADAVARRFDAAAKKLENGSPEAPSLFLFYYSGHTKDGELRLGSSRLGLGELKRLIEGTKASLRVALVDSCRAGAITRLKGAVKGEPVALAIEDTAAQLGQVVITASSDNEDAQESDDIQGSYFTHFLTSALRGAGDDDHDGAVTLSEAYSFAYANTVSNTVGTKGGIQHPTYRFDLRGAGDVVVTRPGQPTAAIILPKALAGRFVLFDLGRKVVVAELEKEDDAPVRVALAPGKYVVKKRERDSLRVQRVTLGAKQEVTVDPTKMEKLAFADDYAKGAVVTTEEIRYGRLGVRLSLSAGAQAFLSAPVRDAYFPALGLFELTLDLDNALRRHLGVRLDLGLGGASDRPLVVSDPYLGEQRYTVNVSEVTLGSALVYRFVLTEWLNVGLSSRMGLISVSRAFKGVDLPKQSFSTITPGLGAEMDLRLTSWLQLGVRTRIHYIFFNVDEPMSLAYIDGGLVMTAVLR